MGLMLVAEIGRKDFFVLLLHVAFFAKEEGKETAFEVEAVIGKVFT